VRVKTAGVASLIVAAGLVGVFARGAYNVVGADGVVKIAVVDLKRIASESKMGLERAKQVEAFINEKNAEIGREREDLKKLVEELNLLDVDSEAAKHKRRIVTERAALLKAKEALGASELQLSRAAAYREVYSKIFGELEKYRKANGLTMILRKDDMDLGELPPVSVMGLLRSNSVLVVDPAVDVTDQILKAMDASAAK